MDAKTNAQAGHCTPPQQIGNIASEQLAPVTTQSKPVTPPLHSTPLHRRFFKEVDNMPSKTPSPKKGRATPVTARNTPVHHSSPSKVRESPTKHNLELGNGAFYFSVELPVSKITPKRTATPLAKTDKSTKSRPATPAKQASQLQKEKVNTPVQTRPGTPIKRTFERSGSSATRSKPMWNASGKIRSQSTLSRLVSSTSTTSKVAQKKEAPMPSPGPENIGQMMAGLKNGTFRTYDWAHNRAKGDDDGVAEHNVSPAPTPLRKAMEILKREEENVNVAPGIFESPEATILPLVGSTLTQTSGEHVAMDTPSKQPKPEVKKHSADKDITPQNSTSIASQASRPRASSIAKRPGTDPKVRLAMRKDMGLVQTSLRRSSSQAQHPRTNPSPQTPLCRASSQAQCPKTDKSTTPTPRTRVTPWTACPATLTLHDEDIAHGVSIPRSAYTSVFDVPSSPTTALVGKVPSAKKQHYPPIPRRMDSVKNGEAEKCSPIVASPLAKYDNNNTAPTSPSPTPTAPTPNPTSTKSKSTHQTSSHTPPGSPSHLPHPSSLINNSPTRTPIRTHPFLKRIPKTATSLRTPVKRVPKVRVLDRMEERNATRTPSKAIEKSLGEAIDAVVKRRRGC